MSSSSPASSSSDYDAYKALSRTRIEGLLDGKAFVQLVDVSPRICPTGYTPEFRAVEAARCSFGRGLKTPTEDKGLLLYLLRKGHTSPLEMANATFQLKVPKFVSIQLLRHRTARVNEFSQRYAEIPEANEYYQPLLNPQGVRSQSKTNKQGSEAQTEQEDRLRYSEDLLKSEVRVDELHVLYHKLVKGGLAKEIARTNLPIGEYSTLYYQLDLNNLLKFLNLRADFDHAQHETATIATAMMELVEPLFPTSIAYLRERMNGIFLSASELEVVRTGVVPPSLRGTARSDLLKKVERLGRIGAPPSEVGTVSEGSGDLSSCSGTQTQLESLVLRDSSTDEESDGSHSTEDFVKMMIVETESKLSNPKIRPGARAGYQVELKRHRQLLAAMQLQRSRPSTPEPKL